MNFSMIRSLRTPHSERYLLQVQGKDVAALDLHYLPTGRVDGTLIVFDQSGIAEQDIPAILKQVDENLLPEVSIHEGNVSFTVVIGRVLGAFLPEGQSP